jgi:hypothetical protein
MTKGNWERRAELAEARKQEGKLMKAEKKSTPAGERNKCESVYNKIMKDEKLLQIDAAEPSCPLIWVWLQSEEDKPVCSEWFRNEKCEFGKKCKSVHHNVTVSHLLFDDGGSNAPPSSSGRSVSERSSTRKEEMQCDEPVPLRSLSRRLVNRIRIIAVAKECVFDYSNSLIWEAWQTKSSRADKPRTQSLGSEPPPSTLPLGSKSRTQSLGSEPPYPTESLGAIAENGDNDLLNNDEHHIGTATSDEALENLTSSFNNSLQTSDASTALMQPSIPQRFCSFLQSISSADKLAELMLSFLSNHSLIQFLQCSKAIRYECLYNNPDSFVGRIIRLRCKEALSSHTSKMKEMVSKQKKQEKKKKLKQAHIGNQDKRDAFSRGGNGGL